MYCVLTPLSYPCSHPPSLPKDQIEGLKHEMDIDVPKGYRWDGEMVIGRS